MLASARYPAITFVNTAIKEGLYAGVRATTDFQLVLDGELLAKVECADAKRLGLFARGAALPPWWTGREAQVNTEIEFGRTP